MKKNNRCDICSGSGKIRQQQGFFMVEKICVNCSGMGIIIKNPCVRCEGKGRYKREKILVINIPAGIENNAKIKIINEGESGIRNSESGNLYIHIEINNHAFYSRKECDLYCQIPIKTTTAILGGIAHIPTLDGNIIKINIPSGTQNNSKLRLRNKGMTIIRSKRYGDLYVSIYVEIPLKISIEQKLLIEKFDKLSKCNLMPKTEKFFNKLKSFISVKDEELV